MSSMVFNVSTRVRVRSAPGLQAAHLGWLEPGARITVDAGSRTEVDGYIWWQHEAGWSAEKSTDGGWVFMTASLFTPAGEAPAGESGPRQFRVGDSQVRVRNAPSLQGAHVAWLSPGQLVTVEAASRTEADGYIWWKHAAGWSVEGTTDGAFAYMVDATQAGTEDSGTGPSTPDVPVTEPPEDAGPFAPLMQRTFQAMEQVRVRSAPGLTGAHIKWLQPGTQIIVDATSKQEVDGYVWWRHAEGWSAERALDDDEEIYLVDATTLPAEEPPAIPPDDDRPEQFVLQAGHEQVRVRKDPGLSGLHLKWILPGEQITVSKASRTEADGYVWWQHDAGWSAERSTDGTQKFLYTPEEFANRPLPPGVVLFKDGLPVVDTLPMRDSMFQRLPVPLDKTHWWQYYGNNVFAYNLWKNGTKWYKYAQGLHGGLDFGNSQEAVPVLAGVTGTFIKRDIRYTRPNGMWVKVGPYTVIYGHMDNPAELNPGDPVGVDTQIGTFELGGQNHLHLEIRYKSTWIVNPLLFMPEAMRNSVINKFKPGPTYFYSDETWTQWQTPLDQPVLLLGGELIGPHADSG